MVPTFAGRAFRANEVDWAVSTGRFPGVLRGSSRSFGSDEYCDVVSGRPEHELTTRDLRARATHSTWIGGGYDLGRWRNYAHHWCDRSLKLQDHALWSCDQRRGEEHACGLDAELDELECRVDCDLPSPRLSVQHSHRE